MKVEKCHITSEAGCLMDLRRPFRADKCRLRLKFMQHAEDHPGRKKDRHYTIDLEPDVHEVICAMQQMRRWLVDRKAQAEKDLERAGLYMSGDNVYRND